MSESSIIPFYNNMRNCNGLKLSDVWAFSDSQYESKHHFIQWVFPTDEISSVNLNAPIVKDDVRKAFNTSSLLQWRLLQSYTQFLTFLGLTNNMETQKVEVMDREKYHMRVIRPSHNLLRITRALRCLNLLGLHIRARSFYNFLIDVTKVHSINHITISYWNDAMTIKPL